MINLTENPDRNAPAAPANDLAVLRGADRPDLLRNECLADILAATARRRPQHPALILGERTVTYGELDAASGALAGALFQRGAAAGKVVGLFLPRGADLLIAQAGITKSGAAWLPFDAETPLERIKTCLQSAKAIGLVTCREWLPRLAELKMPAWAVEDLLAEKNPRPLCVAAQPADPAYVIYTSGSTGQPKGIVISQRGICHFLRSENEILGVRETDLVYQGFSVAFDMSFEEIWISYLVGATLWIAPPALVGDPGFAGANSGARTHHGAARRADAGEFDGRSARRIAADQSRRRSLSRFAGATIGRGRDEKFSTPTARPKLP